MERVLRNLQLPHTLVQLHLTSAMLSLSLLHPHKLKYRGKIVNLKMGVAKFHPFTFIETKETVLEL